MKISYLQIAAIFFTVATAAITPLEVSNLRCEYLADPQGLDTPQPRFTWELASETHRGLRQLSYRVVVHEAGTEENGIPFWDSLLVESSGSYLVRYAGPPLHSATKYSWSVKIGFSSEDETDVQSMVTSSLATFSTGMLTRNDWTGKFIGMGNAGEECPWFRKKFSLSETEMAALRSSGSSAQLMVASVGYCEATVNGKPVTEGVLLPSISYLPKRIMYRTYDVTSLLTTGDNAIGLWASAGWADYPDMKHFQHAPLVMAELHVNGAAKVVTDDSWKTHESTVSNILHYGNGGFGGDSLDDSKVVDGWDTAALDDSGWSSAQVFNSSLANVSISADVMEPTVKLNSYPAVNVTTTTTTAAGASAITHVVEMSELFTGWFEVKNMQGKPNSSVSFQVSTTKGKAMEFNMQDKYTFGPSGKGDFRMRFTYHEIQFITIFGLDTPPAVADIVGHRLTVNLTRTGSFKCSNDLITRVYDTTVNNYRGITTGGMTVDCPHRERRGYGGDGHTSYQFALDNFNVGSYFTKWARDFADVQKDTGDVPHTAPTVGGGGGPAWSGFVVTLPYQLYVTYGDASLIESMYPTMVRQLDFYTKNTKSDGLLHPWSTSKWDFLGDWVSGLQCSH
jgi:hypothetical protein